MKRLLAGCLLGVFGLSPAAAEMTVESLRDCMAGVVPPTAVVQHLDVVNRSERDDSEDRLRARLYLAGRDGDDRGLRVMLRVDQPGYLAGASYLMIEDRSARRNDGMYVYLPTIRRVRRVEGGFADTALLGTQFSYNEFRYWHGLFGDADAELLHEADGDADVGDGRAVHRLRLKPRPEAQAPYSLIDMTVDAESCLILEADFIQRDIVHKSLRVDAEDLAEMAGYWYPRRVSMRDPRRNMETEIRIERVELHDVFNRDVFSPQEFHRFP